MSAINISAKEKAKELVNKYYRDSDLLVEDLSFIQAKECALITVNEILNVLFQHHEIDYWQEVKKEIELL